MPLSERCFLFCLSSFLLGDPVILSQPWSLSLLDLLLLSLDWNIFPSLFVWPNSIHSSKQAVLAPAPRKPFPSHSSGFLSSMIPHYPEHTSSCITNAPRPSLPTVPMGSQWPMPQSSGLSIHTVPAESRNFKTFLN